MSDIILNFQVAESVGGAPFKMRTEINDTITTVKARLQDRTGCDPLLIELYYVSDPDGPVSRWHGPMKMEDGKLISVYSWSARNGEAEDQNLIIIKEKKVSDIILNFQVAESVGGRRPFKMRSENNDTITTVKVRLQDVVGYDPQLIELYYPSDRGDGPMKMEDGKLISVYSLSAQNGETEDQNLIIIKEKELTLHFKFPNSKIRDGIQLQLRGVSPRDTIRTVKAKLQDSEGYKPENIVLRNPITRELLSDEKTVGELSVGEGWPPERYGEERNPIAISFKRDGVLTSASQTGGRRRRSRSRGSKKRRTRRTRARRTRARRTRARRTRRR
jgi:hypothetical protein